MPTSLTLETARCNHGTLVLTAAGEIDLSNIDAFDQALATASGEAARSGETLTVDLSGVQYLDSAAVNALFTRADHMSGLTKLVSVELAPEPAER
jgi:anti-anti-sigma factor